LLKHIGRLVDRPYGKKMFGETPSSRTPVLADVILADVIESVRAAGIEGVVAKRVDSVYEPAAGSALGARCGSNALRSS
jgi:hypothetical protein